MRVMWALLGRCRGAQLAAGGHECNGEGAKSSSALVGRPATRYFSGCPRWALLCRCALRSRAHVLSRAAALRRAMACCSPSSGDDGRSHADKRPGRQGGHTCINAHIGLHLWLLRARASLPKRLLAARPFQCNHGWLYCKLWPRHAGHAMSTWGASCQCSSFGVTSRRGGLAGCCAAHSLNSPFFSCSSQAH